MKKLLILTLLLFSACSQEKAKTGEQRVVDIVDLRDGKNEIAGKIKIEEYKGGGVILHVQLKGLPPGQHGFHVHEFGKLGNQGKDAGGHFNPRGVQHGFLPHDGLDKAHAGDMGNLIADKEGNSEFDIMVPYLTLSPGELSIDGRSIIIHEKEDNFGQPLGNAGPRIGGGIIGQP